MDQRLSTDVKEHDNGNYIPIRDAEDNQLGMFDKPLPCFGCGIGWFSLLLGFVFPLMWYYATILYFGNYYHKDPRERAGLAANAITVKMHDIIQFNGQPKKPRGNSYKSSSYDKSSSMQEVLCWSLVGVIVLLEEG
ncbi:hypothetical protein F0562_022825 [Nyssa sinensis]|uniref:Uncharacterized protein n=1 Tax=Nyssa sinensis TaxID=561372 RepID=A0A5J5BEV7_9ASTE|nr:hypothetical protein F0562_022825 [Nyssa sinensis]